MYQESNTSFNPHTHTGCDRSVVTEPMLTVSFNPHTHTGCDVGRLKARVVFLVSIHTPIQGVTPSLCNSIFVNQFQSTHPYRVWLSCRYIRQGCGGFNPHTHTGCDLMPDVDSILPTVSIHTPIQGVTLTYDNEHIPYLVSIHTPIQGVTRAGSWLPGSSRVSIHTPIQGVTRQMVLFRLVPRVSIHTPIQGVTEGFGNHKPYLCGFNPHTHTGCDKERQTLQRASRRFNPHTHTGCDWKSGSVLRFLQVSIHTPIQGVTQSLNPLELASVFQSTHPYRVWLAYTLKLWVTSCFNPHTHTGCDL